jgi:hypothetical protein
MEHKLNESEKMVASKKRVFKLQKQILFKNQKDTALITCKG